MTDEKLAHEDIDRQILEEVADIFAYVHFGKRKEALDGFPDGSLSH